MKTKLDSSFIALFLGVFALSVACERPPMEAEQGNYRGLGVETVANPRIVDAKLKANQVPAAIPQVDPGSETAAEVFENVQVLGHLGSGEFGRLMVALTSWVSPEQGCTYCHEGGFAPEAPYTKIVARRMIEMTQHINSEWKEHVGATGVTCYTCHRGMPLPEVIWYRDAGPPRAGGAAASREGQNIPAAMVGVTSLPFDPFSPFLSDEGDLRVQTATALPTGNASTIKDAEWTYGLMVHISDGLGVNCTYCHNSRSFMPWEASSPARVTAWHAIRMVRHLNQDYLEPLAEVLPANRKGPEGDVFKVNCTTCHQGLPKPLLGASMLKDYPELAEAK